MGNVVRWFEDFSRRALDLLPEMKKLAAKSDRLGSLSLLIAPALIVAPYERLQSHAQRKNPQADYLRFPAAHKQFNAVMGSRFCDASFWNIKTMKSALNWKGSQVVRVTHDPAQWETRDGHKPWDEGFWSVDISTKETRWVWKFLRDALSHWNVATSDRTHKNFDESGIMQRLLLYRAYSDEGPWDVISVSPEAFLMFLEVWAVFLSRRMTSELLSASEAA